MSSNLAEANGERQNFQAQNIAPTRNSGEVIKFLTKVPQTKKELISNGRDSVSFHYEDRDVFAVKTLKKSQLSVGDKIIPNEILNLVKIGIAPKELCSE